MGMFGSIGRALGNFNEADPKTGVSWADRIAAASGALAGDPGAYGDFAKLKMQRQEQAQQQAILKELTGAMGPQYASTPDIDVRPRGMIGGGFLPSSALPRGGVPADAGNSYIPTPGELNLPTSAPADAAPEAAPYQFQMPQRTSDGMTIDDPRLPGMALRAQMAGVKMDPILEILKARQPDIRYDRGFGYNSKSGAAVGGFHPDVGEGRIAKMDAAGNPTGVSNLRGYTDAIGQVEAAKAAAQAGFQPVQTHDQYGRPVTTTALDIAGRPMVGSTPAQDAYDQASGTAAGQAAQQGRDAGLKADQTLDLLGQAESLLKGGNVITGFGAEQRLGAERAAATLLKDPKAAARVADTETYQNLVNRQVLPLLKQMGSSNSITDTDREFIKGIVGGSITLNPTTMSRVIDIGKKEAARAKQNSTAYGRPATPGRGSPPDKAVQLLRQNPHLAAAFDQKYGAGAAQAVFGR